MIICLYKYLFNLKVAIVIYMNSINRQFIAMIIVSLFDTYGFLKFEFSTNLMHPTIYNSVN